MYLHVFWYKETLRRINQQEPRASYTASVLINLTWYPKMEVTQLVTASKQWHLQFRINWGVLRSWRRYTPAGYCSQIRRIRCVYKFCGFYQVGKEWVVNRESRCQCCRKRATTRKAAFSIAETLHELVYLTNYLTWLLSHYYLLEALAREPTFKNRTVSIQQPGK